VLASKLYALNATLNSEKKNQYVARYKDAHIFYFIQLDSDKTPLLVFFLVLLRE
jgi:hypothetical protein